MKAYIFTLLVALAFIDCYANTAFFLHDKTGILAKNHDSRSGHGMLIQNLPGQAKIAYGFHADEKAKWTSIYGSVTLNQLGKEFPIGGINEAGLVVEHLFLGTSEYPETNAPSVSELEWIQYQLDNFGSVSEVIANIHQLRIRPLETVHFLVADPCGNSAVIDFVAGEVRISEQNGGFQVMTQVSTDMAHAFYTHHKDKAVKSENNALTKYMLLMGYLGTTPEIDVQLSFNLLDISANKSGQQKTQWGVVYDLEQRCIYVKTTSAPQTRRICLAEFDFESDSISRASPIQTKSIQWNPMTRGTHANLLALGLKHDRLRLDEASLVQHMLDPSIPTLDSLYGRHQVDLVVKFVTNKPSGIVSYILKPDLQPNQAGLGLKTGQFLVEKKETIRVIYNMPKVQLALACFQDTEFKGPLETKIDANANDFSFLRTQSLHSGNVPKYVDTKIDLRMATDVTVRIK